MTDLVRIEANKLFVSLEGTKLLEKVN